MSLDNEAFYQRPPAVDLVQKGYSGEEATLNSLKLLWIALFLFVVSGVLFSISIRARVKHIEDYLTAVSKHNEELEKAQPAKPVEKPPQHRLRIILPRRVDPDQLVHLKR